MPRPFVSRLFKIDDKDICTVKFFMPVADGSDFRCNFEINYGKTKCAHRVFGIDGIQSLILAMSVVQAELEAWGKANKKELTWLGDADLGLPRWTARRQLLLADTNKKGPRTRSRKSPTAK
jgi:hypothetical protein